MPATRLKPLVFSLISSLAFAAPFLHAQAPTYRNPALQLTFQYPQTLVPEDPAIADGYSFRTRFALHPDADPEHRGADQCSPLLLAVGTGPDQPLDPNHKPKTGKQVAIQPGGGMTLNEIFHSCRYRDNPANSDEQSLRDLVENARHVDGAKPIPRLLTYQIGSATILFAASTPGDHDRKANPGYTATVAAIAGSRIFFWSITASDDALFNSMLHAKVCFDAPACAGGLQMLVPYQVDSAATVKPFSE
jgi:hypothetical protein